MRTTRISQHQTIPRAAAALFLLWIIMAAGAAHAAPTLSPGTTQASVSPVNRFGSDTTILSATFTDSSQPGVSAFKCTFRIRYPNNTTTLTLVSNQPDGSRGLTISDLGGGSYTASYVYNPGDNQTLGLYDLYFAVSDSADTVVDDYAANLDELEINEVFPNNPPVLTAGATRVNPATVNRLGANTTVISATFTDADNPGVGGFTVTFKIREPDNTTELVLVNNLAHGAGGLTIIDNGGSYTARYTYDPGDTQVLGVYDLYCEVSDGADNTIDDYAANLDELQVNEVVTNNAPVLTTGITAATPSVVNRFGVNTTRLSATFTDADNPGVAAFTVTFAVRAPYSGGIRTIADALPHGTGGLTIIDNGGGSYTAQIDWDPANNEVLGFYDLFCRVSDGIDQAEDAFDDNPDELQVDNGGENAPPVVQADAVTASPAAVERVGTSSTTLSAVFTDGDIPGTGAFLVTFKLRYPNDSDEIVLADNAGDGTGGVSIASGGGGAYAASITWDPASTETLGVYDLYFHVTDGVDTSYDGYHNNLDELELYDALTNNTPTVVAGATKAVPASITRMGSDFTMLQTEFVDLDVPGRGAFTVTFKVRDPALVEYTIVSAAAHQEQGLRIEHLSGGTYRASVLWDPPIGQVTGNYDLYFSVTDNNAATATDGFANNANELGITATPIAGDGNLLHRTNEAQSCGGPNSACHNIADHEAQDCLVCHSPHETSNIYLVRDTIQTPNSGPKPVIFKTLGIGDPYNDPDPTPGDPTSGVMADDSDGVLTGVCEVCHTSTSHHQNDGTSPIPAHHNAENCTSCHLHAAGFAGGESSGGMGCTCHADIFATMDSTAAFSRHILAHDSATYNTGASGMYHIKNCLTCHVDHDIFRPDLNAGFGQRASNLRVDYGTDPVQGSSTVLANTDYSAAGSGGLCLSCHSGATCSGCHSAHLAASAIEAQASAPSTWEHTFIPKADFDATTSTHNYTVPSTFAADGSTFNANCVKCHNDDMAKAYQSSTNKFSLHGSTFRKILDSTGIATATNPLEEEFCYKCHSTISNPNAGSGQDYYGVKAMSGTSLAIETEMARTSVHPVSIFTGIHAMAETTLTMTRHVECADCHDPHAATPTDPLASVSGVDVDGTAINPATNSYEVCFKCHGDNHGTTVYVTRANPNLNTRQEFHSGALSFHPVTAVGKNPDVPSLIAGWTENSIMTCMDCHGSSGGTVAGPHGSDNVPILKLRYDVGDNLGESSARYALCYSCHDRNSILGDNSFAEHRKHIQGENAPCSVCHDAHGISTVTAGDGSHLINFDTNVCSPDPNTGRLEYVDDDPNGFKGSCWVDCHGKKHSPKSY